MRPLISTGDPKKSVDISRKAELYETSSGMITITGGKLTTWRRMAKMTVDRLVERDARDAPCRTHEIPLGQAIAVEELPRVEGVGGWDPIPTRRSPRATATPPTTCSRWPGMGVRPAPSWPSRSSPACPTCSPRSSWRLAASRRAASATCCCAAPASGCSPPASSSTSRPTRRPAVSSAPVQRVAETLARELGWDAGRLALELERFSDEAREEGMPSQRSPACRLPRRSIA